MDATQSSVVEGVGAVISSWVAGECNRVLGQELRDDDGKLRTDPARDAKVKELDAWKRFKVSQPLGEKGPNGGSWQYQMGAYVGNDGWQEARQGAPGGRGLPGPCFKRRHRGHLSLLQPSTIPSLDDIHACCRQMEDFDPRY